MNSVFRGEMSGQERRRLAERTRRGREEKRRKGLRAEGLVGMPRGVKFDPVSEEWSYVFPDAERIREVFRLFLAGTWNFREIYRITGVGVRSSASSDISRVLRQALYKGIYRVDRLWKDGKAVPRDYSDIYEMKVITLPLIVNNVSG